MSGSFYGYEGILFVISDNNGTKSVSMFNIPWEKDYARNNWVCSRNP